MISFRTSGRKEFSINIKAYFFYITQKIVDFGKTNQKLALEMNIICRNFEFNLKIFCPYKE
jgi:hypothetical protein